MRNAAPFATGRVFSRFGAMGCWMAHRGLKGSPRSSGAWTEIAGPAPAFARIDPRAEPSAAALNIGLGRIAMIGAIGLALGGAAMLGWFEARPLAPASKAAIRPVVAAPAPAPAMMDGPKQVRAARMVIVSGAGTPTQWRGSARVRAAQTTAPRWAEGVRLATTRIPLPPRLALATPDPVVELQPAPLWSPVQDPGAGMDVVAALGDIETGSIQAIAPLAAPRPRPRADAPISTAVVQPAAVAPPVVVAPPGAEWRDPGGERRADRPTVSILLTAIGLDPAASARALDALPPSIAVAIAPIARDAGDWSARAKRGGRITLVETPLEPRGYPSRDPGPMTLLTSAAPAENRARFAEILRRTPDVDGVATYLGGRFMGDAAALRPMLAAWSAKGLALFDNTPGRKDGAESLASALGAEYGLTVLSRSVSLDRDGRARDIRDGLRALERAARKNGHAIGVAVATGASIERLIDWAAALERRGLVLRPLRL